MVATSRCELQAGNDSNYDRQSELKAFDESKAGVRGLIEAGVTKVPRMFHWGDLRETYRSASDSYFSIPIIDLEGIHNNSIKRTDVVRKAQNACEKGGFFVVTNHGIPSHVLDDMINGARRFHEQDLELRKEFYTRDFSKKVVYSSNYGLYHEPAASWKDTFTTLMAPNPPKPEELPAVCRDILLEYGNYIMKLGLLLFELLSEALGLNPNHLKDMGCADGFLNLCHYYPACPEPELTMGTSKHSDNTFLSILNQDHIGGLQVLYEDKWIDMPHMPGSLIVMVGDFVQLITNDRFKSAEHRVLAKHEGPRISVVSFFCIGLMASSKLYGPIKELLSEENPPEYRETTISDYVRVKRHDGTAGLLLLRIYVGLELRRRRVQNAAESFSLLEKVLHLNNIHENTTSTPNTSKMTARHLALN